MCCRVRVVHVLSCTCSACVVVHLLSCTCECRVRVVYLLSCTCCRVRVVHVLSCTCCRVRVVVHFTGQLHVEIGVCWHHLFKETWSLVCVVLVVLICVCVSFCKVGSVMKMGARTAMRAVRREKAAHGGIRGVFGFCVLSMFLAKNLRCGCGCMFVLCFVCVFFNEL